MRKILFGLLAALCSFMINAAGATTLFGTIGYGGGYFDWQGYCSSETTCYSTSYLVKLNPETGAVTDYIGEVGYLVTGLAYDPSNGKLYGGTSANDPSFVGLIEINMTTGAGAPIGTTHWGGGPTGTLTAVTNITVNSAGAMYAFTQNFDDLVSVDKSTGVATVVADSGFESYGTYGLSFNSAGELYLVDWGGDFYLVDTTTGLLTLEDWLDATDSHHGSFDWVTDLYYAVDWIYDGSAPRSLYQCNLVTLSCTTIGLVGNLHTLAFENQLGTTQYVLSVDKAGAGTGTVRSGPAGIRCGTDCSQSYFSGRLVTLYAFADADSTFAGWSGDTDCSDGAVTMDSARSCTATFDLKPTYALSVNTAGTGTGTVTSSPLGINCGSDCSETYIVGTSVTLSAIAGDSSVFAGWSGDADCSDGAVTMDSARSCTATFTLYPTLSVNKGGTGTGTVTSTPAGISCGSDCSESYAPGTSVTLSAAADAGSVFMGWAGDADCSDGAVTMSSSRNCSATFNAGILVTSPNGGDTWAVGVEQTITWTYAGSPGDYVTIELLKAGVLERRIANRVSIGTSGTGSTTWKPQGKLGGSDYSIRITSKSNATFTDTSDANFTITPRH